MKIIDKIGQLFGSKVSAKTTTNAYNEAFFEYIGETGTGYDTDAKSYIDHGYNVNSIVYSIVNQQARKSAKVPFYIKKVDDEQKAKQFLVEIKKENIGQPQVKLNAKALEKKAFSEVETMDMPIEKPNIFQSWSEFISLYKTFLKLTGNVYIYMMAPENGVNAGAPMAFYLLPSHLIDIVLKPGANLLIDDSPIDYYRLIEGAVYKDFPAESVVHIKYSNPNFDINGSHLYGQSPLKSALKNIESANEALTQNIKTLKNSGAFGFIHGKQQPLNPDQAQELKDRLREMDNSPERLSNIAGVSAEVGFTRLTLTTDELQPFAYLSYDEKQLCNVLGWSDKLLNNDAGAKYSNIQESRKQVVTDDIMPDLGLLEQAFNDVILPKYTKYANTMLYFDVSTLPEMQLDMASLTSWLTRALKDGVINRNEYREALNYPILEEEEMDVYTVSGKLNPLERALEEEEKPPMPGVPGLPAPKGKPNAEKKNLITNKGGFDPKQTRNENGQWSKNPGGASPCSFKGWFKDSKVVDADGEPEVFYHGTTHDFDEFTKDRANIENDMGAGFYFSNSLDDVDQNYDEIGPDLSNRIQRRVEELENENNIWEDDALKQATAELAGGQNRTLEVYLSIQNPLIIGGENETYLTYEQEYDEENDEYGEESGTILDFMDGFRYASAGYYDVDAGAVFDGVEFYDGISASDLIKGIKSNQYTSYATDDNGNMAISEIIRSAFENAGFDGIIDNTVYDKFGPKGSRMDGIYQDTKHIIAFDPKQIKSVDAESFCEENPNIYKALGIEFDVKAGFDPNQARSADGTWGAEGEMTDKDHEAIIHYTDEGFNDMNKHLRNWGSVHGIAKVEQDIENLKTALNKLPDWQGTVYRGLDLGGINMNMEQLIKRRDGIISFSSFLSTSQKMTFPNDILEGGRGGGKYLFEIISKRGKDVEEYVYLSGEQEVIFLPKTKFKVLDYDFEGTIKHVKLKEL